MPFGRNGKIVDAKYGCGNKPVVERRKLPPKLKRTTPEDVEKDTGLFVAGDPVLAEDGETYVLPLSRNPNRDEKGIIFDALARECNGFIRTKRWGNRCIRVRIRECSGETLCGRQIKECVRDTVAAL